MKSYKRINLYSEKIKEIIEINSRRRDRDIKNKERFMVFIAVKKKHLIMLGEIRY